MIDNRCIQANDKIIALLKPDFTVAKKKWLYCVLCEKWCFKINKIFMSGPRVNYVGAQDTRLGPWLIMSGRRLWMSGPKLLCWECGRGSEINMLGAPSYYVWAPYLSGPRDTYVGRGPDLLCRTPYLLFRGSEIIMLGPDLSCGHPDLLCSAPEIIMWEPLLCRGPYLSCRGPEMIICGPWLIMWEPR